MSYLEVVAFSFFTSYAGDLMCFSLFIFFFVDFFQGGPTDTEFLFDVFLEAAKSDHRGAIDFPKRSAPPAKPDIKKALMLGSGGLSIGQAGEFDYSGSQVP